MIDLANLQMLTDKAGAHHQARRYSSAEKFYLRALKGAPKHPQLLVAIAALYEDMGKPLKSVRLYERALESKPDYFDAALNLGACLNDLGKPDDAETVLRDALALGPKSSLAHFNLGNALADQSRLDDAIAEYQKALALEPTLADGWFNLGNTFRTAENPEKAIQAYEKAIALRPEFSTAIVNLGIARQTLGQFDTARKLFERALSIDPGLPAAHYQLSLMGQGLNGVTQGISRIEDILEIRPPERGGQAVLHFAAARLHAKQKHYDHAFAHYRAANAIHAANDPFDVDTYNRYIDRLINAYPASLFAHPRTWANPTDLPVFIVGMPRSGTTLVEQIIASHPRAFGAGERPEIVKFVRENIVPEEIDSLEPVKISAFIKQYLAAISKDAADAQRITDKMPANFLNLGLIALMFPAARIIHCRRDPLDTCLSCFFQNFSDRLS
ncbi:MAG: tetratricopeptide repeat protein, partial [Fimbriimonadaceae bacterium]|nr:tetratricopeptide repeat protein [Alphaproteobacteria bacterium]